VTLRLPAPLWVQKLGDPAAAARVQRQTLVLDPVTPALLVLAPAKLPGPTLSGPDEAAPGERLAMQVRLDGPTPLAAQFVTMQVRDPAGQALPSLSEVVRVPPQGCVWNSTLQADAAAGRWQVEATDAVTGRVARLGLQVQ
jgi:hypothetical protein